MSTTATRTGAGHDDPTVPLPAAGGRLETDLGVTTVSPLVCERIAARAAAEVEGVEVVPTGVARMVPWPAGSPSAGASADVHGHTVSVEVAVEIRYPLPVAGTAREIRSRVTRRLRELSGLGVGDVTVTVTGLSTAGRERRRRVE